MESIDLGLNDEFDRGGSYSSDEDVGQMQEDSNKVGEAESRLTAYEFLLLWLNVLL